MSSPMSKLRPGNRCISAGKCFMKHLLLIDFSKDEASLGSREVWTEKAWIISSSPAPQPGLTHGMNNCCHCLFQSNKSYLKKLEAFILNPVFTRKFHLTHILTHSLKLGFNWRLDKPAHLRFSDSIFVRHNQNNIKYLDGNAVYWRRLMLNWRLPQCVHLPVYIIVKDKIRPCRFCSEKDK